MLDDEERQIFLQDLGLDRIRIGQDHPRRLQPAGLMSFLTAGLDGSPGLDNQARHAAPQAAGKIHSDFERGFIRAEVVIRRSDACGSHAAAREKGLIRSEGKEYVMQDGDVVLFRFNV